MHENHNMGYAEYEKSIDKKLQVEKEREKSYEKSQRIINELERQAHR